MLKIVLAKNGTSAEMQGKARTLEVSGARTKRYTRNDWQFFVLVVLRFEAKSSPELSQ